KCKVNTIDNAILCRRMTIASWKRGNVSEKLVEGYTCRNNVAAGIRTWHLWVTKPVLCPLHQHASRCPISFSHPFLCSCPDHLSRSDLLSILSPHHNKNKLHGFSATMDI